MKILVVSCLHGDVENLITLMDKANEMKFDVIVCPGDFTDSLLPKGFSRKDVSKLILEEFRSFGKPVLCVPGSWDKEIIELLEMEQVSIHGKGQLIGDVGFYGFGGAKTPFNLPYEPDESEIRNGLESGFSQVTDAKIKIQVTHAPPLNTKLDMIASGAHVGSEAVREFILRNLPAVAISAHIHEARGTDELGKTKLINSGRFPEGHCGFIEIGKDNVAAKIVQLI